MSLKNASARLIAFYLPQFHPIPENDEWWGKGFTEWTNVAKARALFPGHYQPHVPADLGFYDLRVPETRIAQAELARDHGIEGFCYWHYWFGGKRLLERPFNEVLKSGEPKFPFCLGWANDSWSGIWHGCADRILIEQTYLGPAEEERHFNAVVEALCDKRYVTVDDKPMFYIYKPQLLPNPEAFIEHWQSLAIKAGLAGIYFIGETLDQSWNPQSSGFDAAAIHSPGITLWKLRQDTRTNWALKVKQILNHRPGRPIAFPYKAYIERSDMTLSSEFMQFPSVIPGWDNTPRSGSKGFVLTDSTPEAFRLLLKMCIQSVSKREVDKRIVFVKSWNEWAEGNHLEPDVRCGRGYLQVINDETS